MKHIYILFFLVTSISSSQPLKWADMFGSGGNDICTDLVTDAAGNVYAVGVFKNSVDFDPGPGIYNINELNTNVGDVFCVKLNRDGQLVWAHSVGGASDYSSLDELTPTVTLDAAGNVFVAAHYQNNVDLDPGPATLFLPPPSEWSSVGNFVSKFSNTGTLLWTRKYGGSFGFHWNRAIKTDAAGNIYLAGYFQGDLEFNAAEPFYLVTDPGFNNGYIAKMNTDGDFLWAIQIGSGIYDDYIRDIEVDDAGNIAVTGSYRGTVDFDPSPDAENILQSQSNGADIFVGKYTTDGDFLWAHTFGRPNSTNAETGDAVTFDPDGNVIATGTFRSQADFNPDPDQEFILQTVGTGSQFFLKLSPAGNFIWANTIGALSANGNTSHSEKAFDIKTDVSGNIYAVGHYVSLMDADPGEGVFLLDANGGSDAAFNLKLDPQGNFLWARSMDPPGSNLNAHSRVVAVNHFDEVVVGGRFQGTVNFNPGGNPVNLTANTPSFDAYIMSLTQEGLSAPDFQAATTSVYPNPATDVVFISGNPLAFSLYDATGRLVSQSAGNTVHVNFLESGIYLLKVAFEGGQKTFRILKD